MKIVKIEAYQVNTFLSPSSVIVLLILHLKADLPLVDGDYCWADGKSVSTYDRWRNVSVWLLWSWWHRGFNYGGVDDFFTQHGGCNRHRCWDHRLRRGDISSWLPNSPFLDWVSFLNKENIAGHGEVSSWKPNQNCLRLYRILACIRSLFYDIFFLKVLSFLQNHSLLLLLTFSATAMRSNDN